jgi:hypothetical protein
VQCDTTQCGAIWCNAIQMQLRSMRCNFNATLQCACNGDVAQCNAVHVHMGARNNAILRCRLGTAMGVMGCNAMLGNANAMRCNELQCNITQRSTMQCNAMQCSAMQLCNATRNELRRNAMHAPLHATQRNAMQMHMQMQLHTCECKCNAMQCE